MLEFINKKSFGNYWTLILLAAVLCCGCGDDDNGTDPDLVQFPRISVLDTSGVEGDGAITTTVKLSWEYPHEVSVDYVITELDGELVSALEDIDFVAGVGKVIFAPGETEKEIEINFIDDLLTEPAEQFKVVISNPVLGEIIKIAGIISITNDDLEFFVENVGFVAPTEYQGLNLVWSDEFDGPEIDLSNWTHEIGGNGWGNDELQYYTDSPSNSFIGISEEEGYLVINALEEQVGGNNYTSARLVTTDKREFEYGRVDVRAKLPKGRGIWPAVWMLGANFPEIGWPKCGEIDIMEMVGHQPSIIWGTAHFGNSNGDRGSKGFSSFLSGSSYSDEFHVFSIIWAENSIKWLRDNELFHQLTPADVAPYDWPFNDPQFFIMNVATGGIWPGSPDETTTFPQRMVVDYIRVFQE